MQPARPPRSRLPSTRRTASGLTLLETLVVFVLASLVGTLLVQGAGFFLGQYDNVKRIGREASSDALQQRWFASTVHAMVPYLAEDRRFAGDSASFQGVTTQPLGARSGVPVAARWSIVDGEEGTAVIYAEQRSPCPSGIQGGNRSATQAARRDGSSLGAPGDNHARSVTNVSVGDSQPGTVAPALSDIACIAGAAFLDTGGWTVLESDGPLAFEYTGLGGVWRDRWPVEGILESIPRQVRLVNAESQAVWTASFGLSPEPLNNPRDFR